MASGTAGLLDALFDDVTDPHASFKTCSELMHDVLAFICGDPKTSQLCTQYKSLIHPHFPTGAPLAPVRRPECTATVRYMKPMGWKPPNYYRRLGQPLVHGSRNGDVVPLGLAADSPEGPPSRGKNRAVRWKCFSCTTRRLK